MSCPQSPEPEFSALVYDDKQQVGKIYVRGDMERSEKFTDGPVRVKIRRPDSIDTWFLCPEEKSYNTWPAADTGPLIYGYRAGNPEYLRSIASVRPEKYEGYDCEVYTYKERFEGDDSITEWWIVWELDAMVRVWTRYAKKGLVCYFELRSISEEPQPDSLFEVPAEYTEADSWDCWHRGAVTE